MTGHPWRRFVVYCVAGFAIGAGIGTLGAQLAIVHSLRKGH